MMMLYRQLAQTAKELNLGWFKPLHEAIPELAVWGSTSGSEHEHRPAETSVAAPQTDGRTPHLVLIQGGATKRSSG